MTQIISIHSYRGGTGKSNLTANLTTQIAQQGKRVAVVDTDLQSPGIHVIFGLDQNIDRTLNDYLWGRCAIADAAYDVSSSLGIAGDGCLFVVPSSVESNEIARVLSEGCSFGVLNEGFRQLSQTLELDYLFIDTHPGLNKETLLSIAVSNLVMLILRPDRQDFQGTAVTVEVARQLKARQLLLVLNKVLPSMNVELLRQQIETTYDAPLAGIFPAAEEMMQLGSDGVFCLRYPDHPFSQALTQLVKQITSAH